MTNYTTFEAVNRNTKIVIHRLTNVKGNHKEFDFSVRKRDEHASVENISINIYNHNDEWKIDFRPTPSQKTIIGLIQNNHHFKEGEIVYVSIDQSIAICEVPKVVEPTNVLLHVPINLLLQALVNDRVSRNLYDLTINEPYLKISRFNSYLEVRKVQDDKIFFHLDVRHGGKAMVDLEPNSVEYKTLLEMISNKLVKQLITNHSLLVAAEKIYYPNGNGFNIIEIDKLGLRYDRVIAERDLCDDSSKIVLFCNPTNCNQTVMYQCKDLDRYFVDVFYEMFVAHQ